MHQPPFGFWNRATEFPCCFKPFLDHLFRIGYGLLICRSICCASGQQGRVSNPPLRGNILVIGLLKIQPYFWPGSKPFADPRRRIGGNGSFP